MDPLQSYARNIATSNVDQQYNMSSLSTNTSQMDFRQLLQQTIEQAMALNSTNFSPENQTMNPSTTQAAKPFSNTNAVVHNTSSQATKTANHKSSNSNINALVKEMATKYNVPENVIHAVIKQESNYNSNAKSHVGAQGLMQLMPGTARSLGVLDAFNPKQNIEGGTKYLSQMLKKYGGKTDLALAAYNAGPGNVDKYNGVPPFKETQNYVRNIMSSLT